MGYEYEDHKTFIFSEEGQIVFLAIRDKATKFLKEAGAFKMSNVWCSGDSWESMACVDRLVELGEIMELDYPNGTPMAQNRVFVKKGL